MKLVPRQRHLRLVSATSDEPNATPEAPAASAAPLQRSQTATRPTDEAAESAPALPIHQTTAQPTAAPDHQQDRHQAGYDEQHTTDASEALPHMRQTLETDTSAAPRLDTGAPTLADLIAPAAVEVARDALRIGASWARVLTITGYPRTVYPGWLDTLIGLDEPFDLSLHIHPLASGPMVRTLTRRLVQLHSSRLLDQRRGRLADPEREVAYGDVERLRDALQRGDERVFSVSLYLLARGPTRRALDERCARLVATLNNLQLSCRPATLEHDLGLTSCLPEARVRLLR